METHSDGEFGLNRRRHRTILQKVRTDSSHRRKLILTISVCWSYVTLGWVVCQIGTALPDLQLIARIDLDTASWLFASHSIGYVIGALVSGFLYDLVNRIAIMMVSALGMAICSVCLPYSGSFAGMIVVRVVTGVFCGGSDTGANTIVPSTWGENGDGYMQALYLSYTLGGIISPFATKPFMSQKTSHVTSDVELPVTNYSNFSYDKSSASIFNYSTSMNISLQNNGNLTFNTEYSEQQSNIHYAFIVTGTITFTSFIPYLLMLIAGNFDQRAGNVVQSKEENIILKKNDIEDENQNRSTSRAMPSNCYVYAILVYVAGIEMSYGASEESLADFLVTFCLDYLDWTNASAVLLSSLYWIASCIGGLSGIFIVQKLGTARLLFIALLLWNVSLISIVISSIYKIDVLLWIFITTSGMCMVVIVPTLLSWTNKNVCEISGKVSSLTTIATGFGVGASPRFIGYMMEKYNYVYFFYIVLAESFLCSLLFFIAYLMMNYASYKSNRKAEISIEISANDIKS